MTTDILVSVIVTTYNQETYIEDAIKSILNQVVSFKYEIIIHDDASTDKTRSIVEKYYELYPDIIVPFLRVENIYQKGISPLVESVKISKGKYIAICEGDDYWLGNRKLQMQFDIMEENFFYSFCCHNARVYYVNDDFECLFNASLPSGQYTTKDLFNKNWFIPTASLFIKRQCLEVFPAWFGVIRSQDLVLEILLSLKGDFWYEEKPFSVYRKNALGSISNLSEKPWEYLKLRITMMRKLFYVIPHKYKLYVVKDISESFLKILYSKVLYRLNNK